MRWTHLSPLRPRPQDLKKKMTDHFPTEFETRRAELVEVIGDIGNEFSAVEALWSQFETVMGSTENVDSSVKVPADEREQGPAEPGNGST